MRRYILIAVAVILLPLYAFAQDDMYYTPTKSEAKQSAEARKKAREERRKIREAERLREAAMEQQYYDMVFREYGKATSKNVRTGIDKTVDEYNRRKYIPRDYTADNADNDSITSDTIEFQVGRRLASDTLQLADDRLFLDSRYEPGGEYDYYYCRRLARFDDFYCWHSPYFYANFMMCRPYGWWAGWYDPWFDPWFDYPFDPWYSSWYCYNYGWYGWRGYPFYGPFYSPWYYGYWRPIFYGPIIVHRDTRNGLGFTGTRNHHFALINSENGNFRHNTGSSYSISKRNGGDATHSVRYTQVMNAHRQDAARALDRYNNRYQNGNRTFDNSSSRMTYGSSGGGFSGGYSGGGGFSGGGGHTAGGSGGGHFGGGRR